MKKIAIAITGASGALLGADLIRKLAADKHQIFCVLTNASKDILKRETDCDDLFGAIEFLENSPMWKNSQKKLSKEELSLIKVYENTDFDSPIASGSFVFDAMAICPCSMKTLGKLANSIADNLAVRAAEVALKERRKLVIVPRETPLALTSLRNMCTLSEAGAVILPPIPAFYSKPECLGDFIDFLSARIMASMGLKQTILKEWGNED